MFSCFPGVANGWAKVHCIFSRSIFWSEFGSLQSSCCIFKYENGMEPSLGLVPGSVLVVGDSNVNVLGLLICKCVYIIFR